MNKNDSKKKQFLAFGLCSFLALVLCMVALVITVENVEGTQGGNEENEHPASKTELTDNNIEIAEYLGKLVNTARSDKFVKTNSYTDVFIENDSVAVDGKTEGADRDLFIYLKDRVIGTVDALYGDDAVGTFSVADSKKPYIDLADEESLQASFSVGQTDENGKQLLDDNGNIVDEGFYYITLSVAPESVESKAVQTAFNLNNKISISEEIKKSLLPDCKAEIISADIERLTVNAKVNRLTDEISELCIERVYNVKADLEFLHGLSVFGEKTVEFKYGLSEKFEYFYAGVTFDAHKLVLEKGAEAQLSVNAVIDNDSDYNVKFISSDENIATVDEMGYISAIGSGEAVITVELQYLGEAFTDKCDVSITKAEG